MQFFWNCTRSKFKIWRLRRGLVDSLPLPPSFFAKRSADVTVSNKSKMAAMVTLCIIRYRVFIFIMRKINKVRCLWVQKCIFRTGIISVLMFIFFSEKNWEKKGSLSIYIYTLHLTINNEYETFLFQICNTIVLCFYLHGH